MNVRCFSLTGIVVIGLSVSTVSLTARAAGPEDGAAPLDVTLGAGSTLWLEGTSNVHDFESRTGELAITFAGDAAVPEPADAAGLEKLIRTSAVRRVEVLVPVRSLRSKKEGLDKNLRRALKADEHPNIRCRISRYSLMPHPGSSDTLAIRAEGTLEIAARTRPVTLDATAHRDKAGLWLEGSKALVMSDYGIKPPTMMLGTLRVADRITVHYRLLLTPKAGGARAPSAGAHEKGAER